MALVPRYFIQRWSHLPETL